MDGHSQCCTLSLSLTLQLTIWAHRFLSRASKSELEGVVPRNLNITLTSLSPPSHSFIYSRSKYIHVWYPVIGNTPSHHCKASHILTFLATYAMILVFPQPDWPCTTRGLLDLPLTYDLIWSSISFLGTILEHLSTHCCRWVSISPVTGSDCRAYEKSVWALYIPSGHSQERGNLELLLSYWQAHWCHKRWWYAGTKAGESILSVTFRLKV